MVSVNVEAKKTVDVMIEKADELNIAVETLDNGATVIDCGVNVDGSFKAGELENFILKFVLVDLQMLEFQFLEIYLKNSHFLQ